MMYRLPMISKIASASLKRQPKMIPMIKYFSTKSSQKTDVSHKNNSEAASINYNSDIYDQLDQIQKAESLENQKETIELHIASKSEETMIDSELYSLLMNDIFEQVHVAFDSLSEEN